MLLTHRARHAHRRKVSTIELGCSYRGSAYKQYYQGQNGTNTLFHVNLLLSVLNWEPSQGVLHRWPIRPVGNVAA